MTEFLPISSSGHLVFFQSFMGLKEPPILFDVMLHLGTLLAVLAYFWKDIRGMARAVGAIFRKEARHKREERLLLWIIVGTIPTGLMGYFFRDWFESFFSEPRLVGGMLLVTGSFLWFTRWTKSQGRTISKMTWADSLLIGMVQGLAIIPGISRSGATISAGLYLGLDRNLSATFSFLLSIPAIAGATLLELDSLSSESELWIAFVGTAVAFGVGYLSLKFLMKINRIGQISAFSYYCWIIGLTIIILMWM